MRVLLVEDDEDDYLITRDLLSEIDPKGYELEWAADYESARAAMERDDHDVCLLDYRLGAHTGLELLREARAHNYHAPIILLTGQADREVDLDAMQSGAADYLVKDRLTADLLERSLRYSIVFSQNEQERLQLAMEQKARAQAEETNRLKDEFLATVSHELRTPLNAILGWAKMLESGRLDAEGNARAIETIIRNANSQAQLIEDLLDISRIISGKVRLDARAVDLPPLIEAVVESTSLAAAAKSIKVQTIIDPGSAAVTGDPERLQQIFWNLLSNAIKFTPKDGKVEVRLESMDSHLEFSVSDTGQGIEPEFLPYVFERFRQADGSTTRSSSGLGLGLAIVRHLVELHGGAVFAESEGAGKGATFRVILPLRTNNHEVDASEDKTHQAASHNRPLEMLQPALRGVRVMVVDDEEDARLLLHELLTRSGAEVTACATVPQALEQLQSQRPHVLISDIGIPQEDGYSLIRQVRNLKAEQGGQTPAIALTAYTRVGDRIKALSSGFQMFVPKPLEPAELIAAIKSLAELGKRMI